MPFAPTLLRQQRLDMCPQFVVHQRLRHDLPPRLRHALTYKISHKCTTPILLRALKSTHAGATMEGPYTRALAEYISETAFSSLPASVVAHTKLLVLDTLG